jgi:hypothetical protein
VSAASGPQIHLPPPQFSRLKTEANRRYVMLPGRKQRIEIPAESLTGQTMVRPARFGTVMTASSGTSIHWPSSRTR